MSSAAASPADAAPAAEAGTSADGAPAVSAEVPVDDAPTSIAARLRILAADIKLAHSIFAMPFAILAAFMAREAGSSWVRFAFLLALVILCMILARTWAMLVNRLADRRLDAQNPRTARRALAAGRISPAFAVLVAAGAAVLFIAATGIFLAFDNRWPILLSVPVLAWIALYSFTKRFTALCHLFLGGALAVSPLAAAIAVRPEALADTPALYWIAAMVLVWVAGFDIIYALADVDVDRRQKLFSIPSRLGVPPAITIARILHLFAFSALVIAGLSEPRFGLIFAVGAGIVGALLIIEHLVLSRRGQKGLNMAFFTINGIVSCVLGAAGIVDVLA